MTEAIDVAAATGQTSGMPEGWGEGLWRVHARSAAAGWRAVPASVDDADAWVADGRDELAHAWGGLGDREEVVTLLLRAGLERRPADAALSFQIWPVPAPLVAHVDVWFGVAPDVDPEPGPETRVYDAAGLGAGIQRTRLVPDEASGVTLVGTDLLFTAGEAALAVALEPTLPELHALLTAQFHAFVQDLVFVDPQGEPVRGVVPAAFAAEHDAVWPATVPGR